MTNWQMFKIVGVWKGNNTNNESFSSIDLDKSVEYANCYSKSINVEYYSNSYLCGNSPACYIEIDIDKTKYKNSGHIFRDYNVLRDVPQEVVANRNAIMSASSSNSEVVAMNRELMDRVDRGQQTHFIYQIEDTKTGLKHSWVYKRN